MKNELQLKYIPKVWASVLYILLTLGALFVYLSKYFGITIFTSIYPDFYFHISNFSISLIFGLLGYFQILTGLKFSLVSLLPVFLILANILCETLLDFINIPDIIDMFFGFAGIVISYIALWIIYKKGIFVNPNYKS